MKVFVYPEKTREELGTKRWQISWEQLRDSAKNKQGDDIDFDADLVSGSAAYPTEEKAREAAKRVLESGKPYFGAVTLSQQVVDWFVEEDRVAEWRNVGQPEEISS
jgi:hypothetical protein